MEKSAAGVPNVRKTETFQIIYKVFLICLIFIFIISFISILSIFYLNKASNSFESFYHYQFNSVKHLYRIVKDLLQIRVNMLQEKKAAERGDRNEILWRQTYSDNLHVEYRNLWLIFTDLNRTGEGQRLANRWLEKSEALEAIRNQFHDAINARRLTSSEVLLAQWLVKYRELRDQTYLLIDLQEKIGIEIKNRTADDARRMIQWSYILLALAIAVGFILTLLLARFFIKLTGMKIQF
jgi:hypothetical protein